MFVAGPASTGGSGVEVGTNSPLTTGVDTASLTGAKLPSAPVEVNDPSGLSALGSAIAD